jgi:Prokaryotic homologs of the JAB domain
VNQLQQRIVQAHRDVERGVSGARERLEDLQAQYRTSGAGVTRVHDGADVRLVEPGARPVAARRTRPKRRWQHPGQTWPYGYPALLAELHEEFVGFTIDMTPQTRRWILDETERVGRGTESGGYLFSNAHRLKPWSDSTTIVRATWAGEGARSSPTRLILGDPHEAILEIHREGLEHFELIGDWHSHPSRGATLPSEQDVVSWATSMDSLGREAWVSLIVAPNDNGYGWSMPKFSGWVAGRYGSPSRPFVGRARIPGEDEELAPQLAP